MMTGMCTLAQGEPKQRLTWLFRLYDQNGDGFVEKSELKIAVKVFMKIIMKFKVIIFLIARLKAILAMTDEHFDTNKEKIDEISKKIAESLAKNPEKISLDEFIDGILNQKDLMDLLAPKNI